MADGCEFLPIPVLSSPTSSSTITIPVIIIIVIIIIITANQYLTRDFRRRRAVVNDARAMRVAELINDYRTLQLHISQQTAGVSSGGSQLDGHRVLAQGVAAARQLLDAGFVSAPVPDSGSSGEVQKTQLRQ